MIKYCVFVLCSCDHFPPPASTKARRIFPSSYSRYDSINDNYPLAARHVHTKYYDMRAELSTGNNDYSTNDGYLGYTTLYDPITIYFDVYYYYYLRYFFFFVPFRWRKSVENWKIVTRQSFKIKHDTAYEN